MGPIWQAQLGESLVMLIGPSWEPNLLPYWAPNLGPIRLPNFCSAIRATLGQRQIRQNPGLALNAHSGNEWGKIPVLTGRRLLDSRSLTKNYQLSFRFHTITPLSYSAALRLATARR